MGRAGKCGLSPKAHPHRSGSGLLRVLDKKRIRELKAENDHLKTENERLKEACKTLQKFQNDVFNLPESGNILWDIETMKMNKQALKESQ